MTAFFASDRVRGVLLDARMNERIKELDHANIIEIEMRDSGNGLLFKQCSKVMRMNRIRTECRWRQSAILCKMGRKVEQPLVDRCVVDLEHFKCLSFDIYGRAWVHIVTVLFANCLAAGQNRLESCGVANSKVRVAGLVRRWRLGSTSMRSGS
jgi:hypothetical protein